MWQDFIQQVPTFFQNHPVLSIAWVGTLIAAIGMTIGMRFSKVQPITRIEAISLINKEDAVFVDLRSNADFRNGHIAHAINLLPAEIKKGSLGTLEKHKQKMVIVVCATGMTSQSSANELIKQGFERVSTLKEGLAGWNGENLPLVKGR